ncbi:MAG TPA: type VI secretion system tube protein Hcp [Vicinamibacterales bacterium]|nr:type VI secretion system tube protein Hcp [Vicinamibacterales bacterium]
MKKTLLTGLLMTALCVLDAKTAEAQDAFLLIPGIPGDSLRVRYEGWIDVVSLAQGFDRTLKGASACTVLVGKGLDKAGPLLWAAAVTGQTFATIQIDILRAGVSAQKYYELTLNNAAIVTINTQPLDLLETLTIGGTSATLKYFPQKPDGSLGNPVEATATCK